MPNTVQQIHTLTAGGVGVTVLLPGDDRLPLFVHWGTDPGNHVPDAAYGQTALPLLPVQHEGWPGRPALSGEREGQYQHLRLRLSAPVEVDKTRMRVESADAQAGVAITSEVAISPEGVVLVHHEVTNIGPADASGGHAARTGPTGTGGRGEASAATNGSPDVWTVSALRCLLPVPIEANKILDFTGRWAFERAPQRSDFEFGLNCRENRRGRTGHDSTLLFSMSTLQARNRSGEVWSVHVGWSGNHEHSAERHPGAAGALGGGEILEPGEIRLGKGETYRTPTVYFVHSTQGLDGIRDRMHRFLRARANHPRTPRPVVLNTWEAVYFKHDLAKLKALAGKAAEIGVERFVLDDGWFGGRRDDRAGLGDWFVSPEVWPDGLAPLAEHVRGLGMQFGLWFEPEMVNPDSDLFREHPDWVLAYPGRLPSEFRHQQVLDVTKAFDYLLTRISDLVKRLGIDYIKWDHNRDLVEPTSVHRQTETVYRLLATLKQRHPNLEIESCSSGGARIDLGILEHTDRVWTSDTNDPIDRQQIQLWTGLLLPPELMGAHVGPPRTHVTGRVTELTMRCATALFGHAGLEWDLTSASAEDLQTLKDWVALYKAKRALIHSGKAVVPDRADPSAIVHGVVAGDGSEALFSYAQLTSTAANIPVHGDPIRLRLPGLDPYTSYRISAILGADSSHGTWTGRALETVGLPVPRLNPGNAIVLELRS